MSIDGPGVNGHRWVQPAIVLTVVVLLGALISWATTTDAAKAAGASEKAAVIVGLLHVAFGLIAAAVRASASFLSAEEADEVRREGRALLLGAVALVAAGSSLILLGLAAPGRLVPPTGGLVGALLLNALAVILVGARRRDMDELGRTAEKESGYLAMSWFSLFAGTWAILAHLDFMAAPAPLDWLTMIWGFNFAAGIVAPARKGVFDTPASGSR